jgi:hypothetical protein
MTNQEIAEALAAFNIKAEAKEAKRSARWAHKIAPALEMLAVNETTDMSAVIASPTKLSSI